ncbi:MAG: hypothetical protein QM278_09265 [Pseudomonadota bacterium]|nr:hypothetical protein [Pseudomonadota bacterium]
MPRGDGTGPAGKGPGTGRGRGGRGQGTGMGMGRLGGPQAGGAVGFCICPDCGTRQPHERGIPCYEKQCPNCGKAMIRE